MNTTGKTIEQVSAEVESQVLELCGSAPKTIRELHSVVGGNSSLVEEIVLRLESAGTLNRRVAAVSGHVNNTLDKFQAA